MSVPVYPRTNVWEPGVPGGDEWADMESMRRQIVELRDTVRQIQDLMEYGPIHGSYYPISWTTGVVGTVLSLGGQGRAAFHGFARPVQLTAACNTGSLTMDFEEFDGTSFSNILSSTLNVTTSGVVLKDPDDFSVSEIGEPETTHLLRVNIKTVATSPEIVVVTLTVKGLSKADYL